jgi:pimeloyl-ACP methyl ester carboxylesterase
MANFLLVPGAFHGGWAYDLLRPLLEAAGHTVLTPTLSGVGERSHLAKLGPINLETHILDIAQLIEWNDLRDLVLCGHSYGGLVITGVADRLPDRIACLVYIDAMLPKDGDSAFSLVPALLAPFVGLSAALGGTMVAPWPSAAFGVGPQHQAWVDARLTPHPLACLTQRLSLTGAYRTIAKRILIWDSTETGARPFADVYEAERGTPETHVFALEGSHDLMIDNPQGLAEILNALA